MDVFVVVTYRRAELLSRCLDTMAAHYGGADAWRVVVVHNGGPAEMRDGILERAAADRRMRAIALERNLPYSEAANVGLREALAMGAARLVLVNDDIEFIRPVRPALDDAMADPKVGLVGAKLVYPDGTIQHGGIRRTKRGIHHRFHGVPASVPASDVPDDVCVTGALLACSRQLVDRIGLLDEGFRMGSEDIDYCLRALQAGYRVVYWPAFTAIHVEGATRGRSDAEKGPEMAEADRSGRRRLYHKWGDFLRESIRHEAGPEILYACLSGQPSSIRAREDCTRLSMRGWSTRIVCAQDAAELAWAVGRTPGIKIAGGWAEASAVLGVLAAGETGYVMVPTGSPAPTDAATIVSRMRPLCEAASDAWALGMTFRCSPAVLEASGSARCDALEDLLEEFGAVSALPVRPEPAAPAWRREGERPRRSMDPATATPATFTAERPGRQPRQGPAIAPPRPRKRCGRLGNPDTGPGFRARAR